MPDDNEISIDVNSVEPHAHDDDVITIDDNSLEPHVDDGVIEINANSLEQVDDGVLEINANTNDTDDTTQAAEDEVPLTKNEWVEIRKIRGTQGFTPYLEQLVSKYVYRNTSHTSQKNAH